MGKLLGAQYMVFGSVNQLGKLITVNARLVDVGTGEAVVSKQVKSPSEEELPGDPHAERGPVFYEQVRAVHPVGE